MICHGESAFEISPLVYGETVHDSIAEILLMLRDEYGLFKAGAFGPAREHCFYDLGSGLGKPSITAAVTLPDYLDKCIGIELLDGLFNKSLEMATTYKESSWVGQRRENH